MGSNLGILVSGKGRGSNLAAIARACFDGTLAARVGVVIAPHKDVPAVETSASFDAPVAIVEPEDEHYGEKLVAVLKHADCTLVCLAGYMRLLPTQVLAAFPDRVLNIHPALLPDFGGKGMYGRRVHEAVLASGATESGCTVHLVNEVYDAGDIVLQMKCPVLPNDTPESLAARVLSLEHIAYPKAIEKLLRQHGN